MAATDYSKSLKKDSQEWITLALLEILKTKPLSQITVSEIAKKAGVSRMAFYRHFSGLDDVLFSYYEPKFEKIFDKTLNKISHEQKIIDLTEFFNDLTPDFKRATTTWSDWKGPKRNYWIKFMSAGLFEVWLTWIQTGQKESLEEMTQLIREFHE